MIGLLTMLAGATLQTPSITLDWKDNKLTILSPYIPSGKIEVWYLEAFCRRGSTARKWEETLIPHKTVRLDGSGPSKLIRLETTLEDQVQLTHTLKVVADGVEVRIEAHNKGAKASEADWAQPCVQLAGFMGRTQEDYPERSFLFVGENGKYRQRMLSELPREVEARYKGGQVYIPKGIHHADVNPRPLSTTIPSLPIIGCISADDKWIFAAAFEPLQELFQGVITCLHADFRLGCLPPGGKVEIKGKFYLRRNDIPSLVRRFLKDFPQFMKQ